MIGTTISHYRVIGSVGVGGMGMVYLAEDTRLNRKVALKFLPPAIAQDAHARGRFLQRARQQRHDENQQRDGGVDARITSADPEGFAQQRCRRGALER